MSKLLERRLGKLEGALLPAPVQAFCLLAEPNGDATPEAWSDYLQQVEAAQARGDFVGVVSSSQRDERRHYVKSAEYFASEFEALLARVARSRSQRGNANRLADIIEDASGNVFGAVGCAKVRHHRAARRLRASDGSTQEPVSRPSRDLLEITEPETFVGA